MNFRDLSHRREEEREALSLRDHQQVADEHSQGYEDLRTASVPGRDYDRDYHVDHEQNRAYDVGFSSSRFASEFKRYDQDYRDREGGPAGIDNDFGMNTEGGTQQWIGLRNLARSSDWTRADQLPNHSKSHVGKGPKGYTRSDERVREGVVRSLTDDHLVDASDVEVEVDGAVVTLKGTVPERKMRFEAENCAEMVPGVEDVINQLRITTHQDST